VNPAADRRPETAVRLAQLRLEFEMAQCRCGPDEAFDLLRQVSQSANVKVSVVAARLVRDLAAGDGTSSKATAGRGVRT
jgi:hypothetical protein